MKIRTRTRKIGITGSSRAGKTVFLLSLISHLEAGDLKLDGDGTSRFRKRPIQPGPLSKLLARMPGVGRWLTDERSEFQYAALRNHLAEGKEWPHKTTDSFFFRCRFQRAVSGRKWKNLWRPIAGLSEDEVEFFDFPGERVADVTMIGQDFGAWSDMMIQSINADPRKSAAAGSFLSAIRQDVPNPDAVLAEWKLTLGRLFVDCHALITPSTFLVDKEGNTARERVVALRDLKKSGDSISDAAIRKRIEALRDAKKAELRDVLESAEEYASACCAGLSEKEFVPLPEAVRQRAPELARHCQEHYESYQREVVRPFAADLLSCHSLIFLVDLTDVLGSGVQKLNDTQEMIRTLLDCIERGSGFFRSLLRGALNTGRSFFGGKWGHIDRIAFVASKEDKIHKQDRAKMKPLLDDLAGRLARNSGLNEIGCFACSAITSTKSLPGDERKLVGRPMRVPEGYRPPEAKPLEVSVPALPAHWPPRWKPEDYEFTDFHPEIPAARLQPPPQFGLDEVLKFALDA